MFSSDRWVILWHCTFPSACSVTKSCPTLCDPMDCSPPGFSVDSPGKNTGVDCHSLLQGIFLNQGLNLCHLHCRQILYCWATREAPKLNNNSHLIFLLPPPSHHPSFLKDIIENIIRLQKKSHRTTKVLIMVNWIVLALCDLDKPLTLSCVSVTSSILWTGTHYFLCKHFTHLI